MADYAIHTGPIKLEVTEPDWRSRLARLDDAVGEAALNEARLVVSNAQSQWPVSGDSTTSRDMFDPVMLDGTAAVARNRADYVTEIHDGDLVRRLLDEPLADARDRLGAQWPAIFSRVMHG